MSKEKLWAVADCETDAFDGRTVAPFVWAYVASDGSREVFWRTADFCDWLRNFDGVIYAHNGGRFDWLMPDIISEFDNGQIKLINGRVAKVKAGKAELRDSWLCLPAALAKFGEKDDFDYTLLLREKSHTRGANKAKIEKYILQDCIALFNAMSRFIERHGFALTQAGAALKTWENMGGEKRRYGPEHDARFRPYYFGGRCEAIEYGAPIIGDFEMYDINSSYPAAMSQEHTCGTDFYTTTNYKDAHPSSFWIVRGISNGALGIREKNKTVFPRDNSVREYHCTGHEIHAALEFGALDIIEARGLVPRRFETFKPYVDKFFAERAAAKAAGDTVGDTIAKIFLNSLYGKYGANPETYKDYKVVSAGERERGWSLSQTLAEHDILERPTERPEYFDVAVAASITGYARATLLRAMLASKRVMYCDTDSILCEEFGGVEGSLLGQWKKEAEVKKAWIAGKKCYAFLLKDTEPKDDKKRGVKKGDPIYKTAHKGISKLDATVEDIKQAAAGEEVKIAKSAPNMKLNGAQVFFSRTMKKT